MNKTKRITFRITEEEEKMVKAYCEACDVSQAVFLRKLIQLFMLTYQEQ
jgi:hypothetical protein